jgi:hypothetical protein
MLQKKSELTANKIKKKKNDEKQLIMSSSRSSYRGTGNFIVFG